MLFSNTSRDMITSPIIIKNVDMVAQRLLAHLKCKIQMIIHISIWLVQQFIPGSCTSALSSGMNCPSSPKADDVGITNVVVASFNTTPEAVSGYNSNGLPKQPRQHIDDQFIHFSIPAPNLSSHSSRVICLHNMTSPKPDLSSSVACWIHHITFSFNSLPSPRPTVRSLWWT